MDKELVFIVPEVRKTSEVVFHHDNAPGIRYLAIDKTLYSKASVYMVVRKIKKVSPKQAEYIDWHVHAVDSLYLFLGDEEGMKGLRGIVRFDEGERTVESPMTVFIPKGVRHSYRLTEGSGMYISLILHGDYNAQTFSDK